MKKTTPENTYPTRYPFPWVASGIRRSVFRSTATRTLEFKGKKRVRFKSTNSEEIPEASIRNRFSTNCDPKTSEYAFFKRLKEGTAAHRVFGPVSMAARSNLCNPPKCEIGRRKNVEGDDHLGSLLVTENATPEKFGSFTSQIAVASKKSDVDMKKAKTTTDDIQNQWEQTLSQNSLERYPNSSESSEAQHKHVDIFFKKRQKLCQWIEKNSFPEISDLCSKGGDFVSLLLARLFPQTRKNKFFKGLSKVQQEADTETELLTDSKSDIHLRNFELRPVGNTAELKYVPASDVGPLSYLCSGCELVTKTIPVSYTLGFPTPGPDLEDHGLFTSNHFKEMGEGHYLESPLLSMESHAKDLYVMANRNSSFSCQNTELSLYPMSVSSQPYNQQLNINQFSSNGLWTRSLLSCGPLEQPWLWSSKPTFNKSNIFHKNLLQVESGMSTALDYLSPLPCKSSGVTFDAYSSYHTRRKNDSFMCFPQNSVELLSKGLDEKHPHSGPEARNHGNLEEKCLLSIGSSPATNSDYHSLGYHAPEFPNKVNMSSYGMNMNESATCCGNFNYAENTSLQ